MPDYGLVLQRVATDRAIGAIQSNDDFAATKAFLLLPTTKKSIVIPQFDTDDLLRCEFGFVGADGSYPEAELAMDNISYLLKNAGLDQPVFDGDEDEIQNVINMKVMAGVTKAYRFIDKLAIATFMADASFNELQTGKDSSPSTNEFLSWKSANSSPVEDVIGWKEKVHGKTGLEADSMAVTSDVNTRLLAHPDIRGLLSSYTDKIVTEQKLAAIFGVKNYYVFKGVENTSNKGNATQTKAYQATGKVLVYHKGMSEDPETPAAGRIAYKKQEGGIIAGYTLLDPVKEKTIVRTKANFAAGVQNKDLGILAKDVLAV